MMGLGSIYLYTEIHFFIQWMTSFNPLPTSLQQTWARLGPFVNENHLAGFDSQNQVAQLEDENVGGEGFEFSANQIRRWVEKQKGQSVSFVIHFLVE